MELRPHQSKAVDDIMAHVEMLGTKDMFLWAPPAFGKSLVLSTLARELSGTTVIMVNISALLQQIADHMDEIDLDYSVLKAGKEELFNEDHKVHLVMSQTYYARADKINIQCDNLLIDEGHREFDSKRTTKMIDTLKPSHIIRVSGTPWNQNSMRFRGSELIPTLSVQELQDKGYLSPIKYLVPKWSEKVDYSKLSTSGGDYSSVQLDEIINTDQHLDLALQSMNQCDAKSKKILVFCSTIEQCDKFAKLLRQDGYSAQAFHSKIDKKLNDSILEAFKSDSTFNPNITSKRTDEQSLFEEPTSDLQEVKVLLSVAKLNIGFDCPSVNFGVLLSKTVVYSKYIQSVMRLARIDDSKEYSEVLDMAQMVSTFGFHTDHFDPIKPTGDPDSDKKAIQELKESQGLPNLDLALDDGPPAEIDLDHYTLIIKQLKAKEEKIKDKKADIRTWDMKDLASLYDITNDFQVVIKIGAEIMTRKFGKGISKAGRPYDYDPEWIGELIPSAIAQYPEKKFQWLKAYKTRCRNIIKEGKNFNALRFFIDFLVKNHREAEAPIYQQGTDDVQEYTGIKQPPAIDLDISLSEIPF